MKCIRQTMQWGRGRENLQMPRTAILKPLKVPSVNTKYCWYKVWLLDESSFRSYALWKKGYKSIFYLIITIAHIWWLCARHLRNVFKLFHFILIILRGIYHYYKPIQWMRELRCTAGIRTHEVWKQNSDCPSLPHNLLLSPWREPDPCRHLEFFWRVSTAPEHGCCSRVITPQVIIIAHLLRLLSW